MLFRHKVQPATTGKSRRLGVEALEAREVLSSSTNLGGHLLDVHQGDSHAQYQTIQAAVNAAQPGDEIRIFSGTYREAVTVSKSGLTIMGAAGATVTIENPGTAQNGITVAGVNGAPINGFTLANVAVSDFAANGVFLIGVSNFKITHVIARNNAEYGLYPVLSWHGTIESSTASGSNDSGIYVGQSSDIVIGNNIAFNNVNGIEVENSTRVDTTNNTVFDNTVGILVDLLPAGVVAIPGYTPIESSANDVVEYNRVFANNRPNTAPSNDIASVEPAGTGIALVGGNQTLVQYNLVLANAYSGIAVLAGADLLALAPPGTPDYSPGVDANPNNTLIKANYLLFNGFAPPPANAPSPADLVWTGTGKNNHWVKNYYATSSPGMLP